MPKPSTKLAAPGRAVAERLGLHPPHKAEFQTLARQTLSEGFNGTDVIGLFQP